MFDIWLRSVRASHTFVGEDHITEFQPKVRDYLASDAEFWVLCGDDDAPLGFMGLDGAKVDALFFAPEQFRRGGGRAMVRHAQELRGELTVDVNEQNEGACRFYQACGFTVVGRSERDGNGLPFPLLHMRFKAANG
jgi:putative acetyltransferase